MPPVIWHYRLEKFVALCRPAENRHLMTTPRLADVDCPRCLEIADDIRDQLNTEPEGDN